MDTPWFRRIFLGFFGIWMRRRIESLFLHVDPAVYDLGENDRPVILAANHLSWWDGFLLAELHRRIFRRHRLAVVMEESEFLKRRWMRWLGVIPLDRGKVWSFRRLLNVLEERVGGTGSIPFCIFYFPQGRFWPSHKRPLGLERGVEILHRQLAPVQVVPVGIHFDWGASPSPVAWLAAGAPLQSDGFSISALDSAISAELDRIQNFVAANGERAGREARCAGFDQAWGVVTE